MVFEEFFLKKKIDLSQLQNADPSLYAQFKSHYAQMSEKSFDHTKKYWFNKLRHEYPLSAEEEIRLKEQLKGDKDTPASEALIETPGTEVAAAKPTGFKPKFKAPVVKQEETTPVSETEEVKEEQAIAKPAGFKPRFKAGVAPAAAEKTEELPPKEIHKEETSEATKPVGFKPRFKAGATKVANEDTKEELPPKEITKEDTPAIAKPSGFKPRFKAGATAVVKEELPPKQIEETTPPTTEAPETPAKPLGFKPRFKAGSTKVNKSDEE